jgi:anthranilate phosphoribosyltransferase
MYQATSVAGHQQTRSGKMITHEEAHKRLVNSFEKTVTADMEIGFLSAWQMRGNNVEELLAKLEELSEAVKTPCNEKTADVLKSADVMINEYRSNI